MKLIVNWSVLLTGILAFLLAKMGWEQHWSGAGHIGCGICVIGIVFALLLAYMDLDKLVLLLEPIQCGALYVWIGWAFENRVFSEDQGLAVAYGAFFSITPILFFCGVVSLNRFFNHWYYVVTAILNIAPILYFVYAFATGLSHLVG